MPDPSSPSGFRRVIRLHRRLGELKLPSVDAALDELTAARLLLSKLTPTQRAWLEGKGAPNA